jgi:hypothetical protein
MESNLQGEDIMESNRNKELEAAKEIIAAIDHWLEMRPGKKIDKKVGKLIQNYAMRDLAFVKFINDDFLAMDDLRILANDKLVQYNEPRIPKPIPAPLAMSPGCWSPVFFPTYPITPVKTRREELEEMSVSEIRKLHEEAKIQDRKRLRIDYILESEKDYK